MKIYLLILSIIIIIMLLNNYVITEDFGNYFSPCKPQALFKEVLNDYKYEYNKDDWEYYIPCTYNTCEKKIIEFEDDKVKKKCLEMISDMTYDYREIVEENKKNIEKQKLLIK